MSNAMSLFNSNETATMSSLEIAELTGKRHDHVMADVRKALKSLGLHAPDFLGAQKYGNNNTREVFNLPKMECDLVVSGYSLEYRAAIVRRWHELEEAHKQPQLPDFTDPALMAREWAAWFEKDKANREEVARLEHEAEIVKPKVAGYDALMNTNGTVTMKDIAHTLAIKGLGQKKLFEFLRNDGVLMKGNHPYQKDVNRGFFKSVKVERNGRNFLMTVAFPRGVEHIVKRLRANGYDI